MRILLAAIALTSLTAACGGDSGGDKLSKAEFIAEGDALCAALTEATDAVEPPETEADFAEYLTTQVDLAEETHADFAALDPPADGESVHEALLASLRATIDAVEGAATAADGGDTVSAEDLLAQASVDGAAADEEADAYGFQECGSER